MCPLELDLTWFTVPFEASVSPGSPAPALEEAVSCPALLFPLTKTRGRGTDGKPGPRARFKPCCWDLIHTP